MVITALTRNQVARKGSWVRIPPPPPIKKDSFGCLFLLVELSVPLARNVKLASQVKCRKRREAPAGVGGGTLNFTLRRSRNTSRRKPLHLPVRANFTLQSTIYMPYYI